jgi:hypothetical protein
LISINGYECHEYAFRPSTNNMQEIAKDKIVIEEKNGRKVCQQSSNYKNVWNKIRGKQYLDEEQFKIIFGRYDLSGLYPLVFELIRNKYKEICDNKKNYKLSEKILTQFLEEKYFKYYISRYSINNQKSFAVYNVNSIDDPALLIDLSNMSISTAFCDIKVDHPVWDKTGQYLAYSTSPSHVPDELIATANIKNASIIMEKRINKPSMDCVLNPLTKKNEIWNPSTRKFEGPSFRKIEKINPVTGESEFSMNTYACGSLPSSDYIYIEDISWNPSSDHIAVLTHKSRMGKWPLELLGAAMGHARFYDTFFLSIYDMNGKELLTQKVVSDVANGKGSIVWTDE